MKATLYVKGVRIKEVEEKRCQSFVVQDNRMDSAGSALRVFPDLKVVTVTTYKSVLSEDQKALVEGVKALAVKYGFELKVTDVTEGHFLNKLSAVLKRINTFPTLVTDNGLKIEGDITEERIKALLAR